uniref:Uncharacterized protein n=1 Tax=virus sp. ctML55 TaxID=2827627 RepID=A0A8S5RI96_9VIRU|nr:MAG TPA: hypothetical protein [virus sp. ctML55]
MDILMIKYLKNCLLEKVLFLISVKNLDYAKR